MVIEFCYCEQLSLGTRMLASPIHSSHFILLSPMVIKYFLHIVSHPTSEPDGRVLTVHIETADTVGAWSYEHPNSDRVMLLVF